MPSILRNALVPYSADAMYQLVNDVNAYPEFLPGCEASEIISQSDTHMHARMVLAKAGIKQSLSTSNELVAGQKILMNLSDGPFKSLKGGWTFTPLSDDACKIELHLDFVFSSKLVELAFGKIFNTLASSMVSAFTERAKKVYG